MKKVVTENDEILNNGFYLNDRGEFVNIDVHETLFSTHYSPEDLESMLYNSQEYPTLTAEISVTDLKSGEATRLLATNDTVPAVLNFASAKNPGGGYKRGSVAQEEDLCRCSTLYYGLLNNSEFYKINRESGSHLYTDHIIYSPNVLFFRDEYYNLLEQTAKVAVITSPAPNVGAMKKKVSNIKDVLLRRVGMILALAEHSEHSSLVLGAWGCGIFKNDPEMIADCFNYWLKGPRFCGAFDKVVFAIFEKNHTKPILNVFKRILCCKD